ncbi:putative porin [Shewanella waksmanii]|uniref:putative porin n=1 Tax=Shewanella waksmanii TaxID=213783 RepID=UPI00048C54CF|nr:putative porin [Shewanella waksmanii]
MKTLTKIALLTALASTQAFAAQDNPFQHQAGIAYNTNSEEVSDGIWNANYRYYVSPVDQANSPYALNGFLAQTTNFGAQYSNFDAADAENYGVDGTYVFASKWFIGANYQKSEVGSFDVDTYGAQLGFYFNETSAVAAFYNDGEDGVEESYGLQARSYLPLASTSGVDLQAAWTHFDSDDLFNVGADWYVTDSWSVGAGYHYSDDDDAFDVRTAYWLRISDSFSANFAVAKVVDSDYDGVDMSVGVIGRF